MQSENLVLKILGHKLFCSSKYEIHEVYIPKAHAKGDISDQAAQTQPGNKCSAKEPIFNVKQKKRTRNQVKNHQLSPRRTATWRNAMPTTYRCLEPPKTPGDTN